jgi:hypothetical protein
MLDKPTPFAATLPQGSPPELITAIADAICGTLQRHGATAFAAPREAALAHEVGHAIVGAHEGLTIRSVSICAHDTPGAGVLWGGRCTEAGAAWTSGPDTTADDDLRRARFIVAGLAGEALTGQDKPGSSLDEVALSQVVGLNAAVKLADTRMSDADYSAFAQRLWHEKVWDIAVAILRANHGPCMQLAALLDQHEHVHGARLRNVLAQVQQVST